MNDKCYDDQRGFRSFTSGLHSAMKKNVSFYRRTQDENRRKMEEMRRREEEENRLKMERYQQVRNGAFHDSLCTGDCHDGKTPEVHSVLSVLVCCIYRKEDSL